MPDPKVTQPYFGQPNKVIRVTSLEQMSFKHSLLVTRNPASRASKRARLVAMYIE